jgi:type I restriction enzyme R subunit
MLDDIKKTLWATADKLRLMVKRILRKYKYPPDLQDAAVELVLQQAQVNGEDWLP